MEAAAATRSISIQIRTNSRPLRRRVAPFSSFARGSVFPRRVLCPSFLGNKKELASRVARPPEISTEEHLLLRLDSKLQPCPAKSPTAARADPATPCSLTPRAVDLRGRGDGGAGAAAAARGSSLHTSYFIQACGFYNLRLYARRLAPLRPPVTTP